MPEVVLAGWAPVRAPYASLREALSTAEQRLNDADAQPHVGWRQLRYADTDRARTAAVNGLLAETIDGWQLTEHQGRWCMGLIPQSDVDPAELAAVQALVLLVEADGWTRFGRCNRRGCDRAFLDWTNSAGRRACRAHRPGPQAQGER